jgi:hypothetical protein
MAEAWETVLRDGVFPQLTDTQLAAAERAVRTDDPRLIQKQTVSDGYRTGEGWLLAAAGCFVGYCGMAGGSCRTVLDVRNYFNEIAARADRMLNERASLRWFLVEYDGWDRDEMRKNMLRVLKAEIARRAEARAEAAELAVQAHYLEHGGEG